MIQREAKKRAKQKVTVLREIEDDVRIDLSLVEWGLMLNIARTIAMLTPVRSLRELVVVEYLRETLQWAQAAVADEEEAAEAAEDSAGLYRYLRGR